MIENTTSICLSDSSHSSCISADCCSLSIESSDDAYEGREDDDDAGEGG